jgi:hypothetical protein
VYNFKKGGIMGKFRERFSVFLILFPFLVISGLPIEVGVELTGQTRYVWRGLRLSRGPVAQPTVWLSFAGWTISPWANITLGNKVDGWGLKELDLNLGYQLDLLGVKVEPSATGCFYPDDWTEPELALGVNFGYEVGELELSSEHTSVVFPSAGGYFGTIGAVFSREVGYGLAPEMWLACGWGSTKFNEINYGVARWALNVIESGAGLNYALKGLVDVKPFIALSVVPDKTLRNDGGERLIEAVGGLTITRGL